MSWRFVNLAKARAAAPVVMAQPQKRAGAVRADAQMMPLTRALKQALEQQPDLMAKVPQQLQESFGLEDKSGWTACDNAVYQCFMHSEDPSFKVSQGNMIVAGLMKALQDTILPDGIPAEFETGDVCEGVSMDPSSFEDGIDEPKLNHKRRILYLYDVQDSPYMKLGTFLSDYSKKRYAPLDRFRNRKTPPPLPPKFVERFGDFSYGRLKLLKMVFVPVLPKDPDQAIRDAIRGIARKLDHTEFHNKAFRVQIEQMMDAAEAAAPAPVLHRRPRSVAVEPAVDMDASMEDVAAEAIDVPAPVVQPADEVDAGPVEEMAADIPMQTQTRVIEL